MRPHHRPRALPRPGPARCPSPPCRLRQRRESRPRSGSRGRSPRAPSCPAIPRCAPRCRQPGSREAGCCPSGSAAADPLGSDVVVATPALRSQFGTRLESVYAPAVIASFGSGAERIDIRAIAPDGARAFESALAADRRARIVAGSQLLRNPRVLASADARPALMNGEVDPRLLLTLAALAAQRAGAHPRLRRLLARRRARQSRSVAPRSSRSARKDRAAILSFLDAQRPPFLPMRAALARYVRR